MPNLSNSTNINLDCFTRQKVYTEITKWIGVEYGFYLPITKEKLPLIVYLHPVGGHDRRSFKDTILYDMPVKYRNEFALLHIYADNGNIFQNDKIRVAIERVLASCDKSRVYLAGFSMGARGVWNFLSEYSDMITAAVAISGYSCYIAASQMKEIPIIVIHGINDSVVPVVESDKMVIALNKAGNKRVIYNRIAGMGHHDSNIFNRETLYKWFLKYRRKNGLIIKDNNEN